MADQPIPVSTANKTISEYSKYMTNLGVNMNQQTQSVSFSRTTVMHWLGIVMPFADELRIFMGTYPDGNPHAGRTTVILWPYLNGNPATDGTGAGIDPYNDGAGIP
jgi:hypothetical protein